MKYKPEDYSIRDSGFYGFSYEEDIQNYKEKLVKCRKPHKCMGGCEKEIPKGAFAIRESGFMDGEPISSYTCTDCMDEWLDEVNGDSEDERSEDIGRD